MLLTYPFDNEDVTESQYSRLFRELQDSGVAGSYGDNTFAVSADGAGLDVQIAPGFAIIRGHAIYSTAVETIQLSPADTTKSRVDLIVLQLDPAANSITIVKKNGTPGSGAPVVTQTDVDIYELPLASITVPANAVNVGQAAVADLRTFVGSRQRAWRTSTRPTSPRKGVLGYNVDTPAWEFWDGTTWQLLSSGFVAVGTSKMTVAPAAPASPSTNDIWIQGF